MNQPAKKIDAFSINFATDNQRHRRERIIELAKLLTEDPGRKDRRKKGLCVDCYYESGRIGGAAITTRPCGCCGEEQCYGSTATDVLCLDCAKLLGLCKQCGATMELTRLRGKTMDEVLEVVKEKQDQIKPATEESR